MIGQLGQQCSRTFLAAEDQFSSCASRAIADPSAGAAAVPSLRGNEGLKRRAGGMAILLYKLKEGSDALAAQAAREGKFGRGR